MTGGLLTSPACGADRSDAGYVAKLELSRTVQKRAPLRRKLSLENRKVEFTGKFPCAAVWKSIFQTATHGSFASNLKLSSR
jgi:hypothetical protein